MVRLTMESKKFECKDCHRQFVENPQNETISKDPAFKHPLIREVLDEVNGNVRNFVPFMSGAKNAHKSPFFILPQGKTFNLPWISNNEYAQCFLV